MVAVTVGVFYYYFVKPIMIGFEFSGWLGAGIGLIISLVTLLSIYVVVRLVIWALNQILNE